MTTLEEGPRKPEYSYVSIKWDEIKKMDRGPKTIRSASHGPACSNACTPRRFSNSSNRDVVVSCGQCVGLC